MLSVIPIMECPACGGTYPRPEPPEQPYFHVCPPVPNPDFQPDPRAPEYDPRELIEREGHVNENLPILTAEHNLEIVKRGGMLVPKDPPPPPPPAPGVAVAKVIAGMPATRARKSRAGK